MRFDSADGCVLGSTAYHTQITVKTAGSNLHVSLNGKIFHRAALNSTEQACMILLCRCLHL